MKLIVPYLGKIKLAEKHLVRLSSYTGVDFQVLPLADGVIDPVSFLGEMTTSREDCFALNPLVLSAWLRTDVLPPALMQFLSTQFPFVFVYHLIHCACCGAAVKGLSGGRLQSVVPAKRPELGYEVSSRHQSICGAFTGLTFGPANVMNDSVISVANGNGIDELVKIGGELFFARVTLEKSEVFLTSGEDIADIGRNVDTVELVDYFSQLIPAVMFLRYAFRKQCWHPATPKGTLIIDDPPLWKRYGFLKYDRLLSLMDEHHFCTSVAFIPYYYRRTHPAIVRMFQARPDRLSICYHGKDHTKAEFSATNAGTLNSLLNIAIERMQALRASIGIACDEIMVFPQGCFSREAMSALKKLNFVASVGSGHSPYGERVPLTIEEKMQPAIMKYSEFPLFLRMYPWQVRIEDIAFNAFFGKPMLLVEHHGAFKDPSKLIEVVNKINKIVPGMQWVSLKDAIMNSYLSQRYRNGTHWIRAFASAGIVRNASEEVRRYCIEWRNSSGFTVEAVLLNGVAQDMYELSDKSVRVAFEMRAGEDLRFDVVYQRESVMLANKERLHSRLSAYVRRTLSEFRDNYLSKSPKMLAFEELVYGRLLRKRSTHRS